ncbi:nitronate monooxygenase [Aneurinibacillus thermoaerophilus]|jgi:NAD(P)H-dependent flavin oxidoreductase YrpB (nitropropane dioxygenase family)|uniref:Probable nitronate monooxygenase n=1 Tax=Aneurinibacillus thermoaerophilus TaxID=143495 RepID=A0ABX8Y7V6_ANETH|nr:nitronate monooxygenase [Aneurinibacillus thermoaerophilus]MED0675566.1 nitronate monooxygenase [Aneurinibacillus thermoaerophilus]MED0681323.1 nitronate monooxygenase [Aneurinibacillus thermoaerophilus]MED0756649.1 nitronate monooxygenase [Aneurinibacillus thermoaerophilus]MED0760699.1 nitronate monooxygenase [Aneurinibacillus thermoaerophilus]MED0764268.1 nitronate monooxygenase [Aneurinibacillus thermoaerophilus]
MKTRITEIFGIKYPIVQGGLAYLAYAELAAAVSNAGGLGQITAMTLGTAEKLREEIRKVRTMTNKPFGVNFAIGQHGRPYEELLEVAIEEKVPAISVTGGNPKPIFERLQGKDIRTLVLVAGVRQAQKAEELGADAVMAVGQEGGGHLGRDDIGTMVLIPRVVESVSIPVLASGGIGDGRGLLAALALGAEGIEMGTRFIATQECIHASEAYKQAILTSKETDTVIIKRTLGAPGRVLKTPHALNIVAREQEGATYEDLKDMISGKANREYIYNGNEEAGYGWAGQVIGLIHSIPTVQELFDEIISQAEEGRKRLEMIFGAKVHR